MKQIRKASFKMLFFTALFYSQIVQAQQSAPMGGGLGGSRIEGLKPMTPAGQAAKPGAATQKQSPSTVRKGPPQPTPQQATYLHPGILVFRGSGWEGGDHLLNLTNNIGVYVTVVKPEGDNIDVSEGRIQKQVEEIFRKAGIIPITLATPGTPPLPAFQIQILIYPVDKGYVASAVGRLFESVSLQRFHMDSGMAFQGITWEKMSLQVGPTTTIIEQIENSAYDIANSFAERFQQFEQIKRNLSQ